MILFRSRSPPLPGTNHWSRAWRRRTRYAHGHKTAGFANQQPAGDRFISRRREMCQQTATRVQRSFATPPANCIPNASAKADTPAMRVDQPTELPMKAVTLWVRGKFWAAGSERVDCGTRAGSRHHARPAEQNRTSATLKRQPRGTELIHAPTQLTKTEPSAAAGINRRFPSARERFPSSSRACWLACSPLRESRATGLADEPGPIPGPGRSNAPGGCRFSP